MAIYGQQLLSLLQKKSKTGVILWYTKYGA